MSCLGGGNFRLPRRALIFNVTVVCVSERSYIGTIVLFGKQHDSMSDEYHTLTHIHCMQNTSRAPSQDNNNIFCVYERYVSKAHILGTVCSMYTTQIAYHDHMLRIIIFSLRAEGTMCDECTYVYNICLVSNFLVYPVI